MCSYCSSTPLYHALLLCVLSVHWSSLLNLGTSLTFGAFCCLFFVHSCCSSIFSYYVFLAFFGLFKIGISPCIFLCMCGRRQIFSTPRYFVLFCVVFFSFEVYFSLFSFFIALIFFSNICFQFFFQIFFLF